MGFCLMIQAVAVLLGCGFVTEDTGAKEHVAYQIFQQAGDCTLGGLFPIHFSTDSMENHWKPEPLKCESLNSAGFVQALAMKFTVEEINNSSTLLPEIGLGYEIYDTCLQSVATIHSSMFFITSHGTQNIDVLCNFTQYRTRVMAVIGPSMSEMALASVKLLSFFRIPQISYAVTSETFSNKKAFPSFLRTVPNDKRQMEGMVELINHFQWNWIAVIASDDDYGRGVRQFSALAALKGICIAYEGFIPLYLTSAKTNQVIRDILYRVQQTRANVTVVFASVYQAKALFQAVIKQGLTKVWLASASWVISELILYLPGIDTIGTVIGFSPRTEVVPGFEKYISHALANMRKEAPSDPSTTAAESSDYYETPDPFLDLPKMLYPLLGHYAQSVYTAVYSVAHTLHRMLKCQSGRCQETCSHLYPWQLLEGIKKVNFTILNTTFYFDENGSPNIGYDIVTWTRKGKELRIDKIGQYSEELDSINSTLIKWQTAGNKVPPSQCSKFCKQGQVKIVKGFHSCCFDCIDCLEGTFQTAEDAVQCKPCPEGEWSTNRSTSCSKPTFIYMEWGSALAIVFLLFTVGLMLLLMAIIILFWKHLHLPVVQAAGGKMTFLTLLSLMTLCSSVGLFIGKPTDLLCQIQLPFLALSITTCLTTFLVKSLQVIIITDFKTLPLFYLDWLKTRGTWIIIALSIIGQCLFCIWHTHILVPLSVAYSPVTFLERYLMCDRTPLLTFVCMFGYNGLLGLSSFVCNCLAQKPLKKYNLARDITFSMLGYLVIWVIFIPVYANIKDEAHSILYIVTILTSTFVIIAGYFLPKCYIIVFKLESVMADYFQIYIS
ncbi:taste receptor type 1 member 3-like [Microcaecilia unicolor]|uniref:Taste receptor type 1 member 3 n=1 Tax=Microcaecilia unicolor TaxID=1415580 RepID=A0A6P7ZVY5_9AMPH|nr:taste receptor type 1 member 3-like [Microcaecilia unicolor]